MEEFVDVSIRVLEVLIALFVIAFKCICGQHLSIDDSIVAAPYIDAKKWWPIFNQFPLVDLPSNPRFGKVIQKLLKASRNVII